MVLKSLINIHIIFISNFIQLLPLLHCKLCQVEPLAVTEPSSISRNSIPNLDTNF